MALTLEDLQAIGSLIQDSIQPLRSDIQGVKNNIHGMKVDIQDTKDDIQGLKDDIQGVKVDIQDTKDDIQGLKDDIHGMKVDIQDTKDDIQGVKVDIQDMKDNIQSLDKRLQKVENRITHIGLTLENKTNHNIQLLAKNHINLVDKLNEAIRIQNKSILYEVQVSDLKSRVEHLEQEMADIKLKIA